MTEKIPVSVTGLPGDMPTRAAEAIAEQDDMHLVELSLTGPDQLAIAKVYNKQIELFGPDGQRMGLNEMKQKYPRLVIVDYSKGPMHGLGALYAENEIPFVFGGTIGDRGELEKIVKSSNISALIAPNMSLELNIFAVSYLENISREFPGLFKGYKADIIESHQQSKPDVSGTARAWKKYLEELGMEVTIRSARTEEEYRELGIPEEHWGLHGYHWVRLSSPDGHTRINFSTQVDGRDTYKHGTPRTARFMYSMAREGSKGEVFGYMDAVRWELGKKLTSS